MTLMARGWWITLGGVLGIWFSPDAAIFAGVTIGLIGWAESILKERRKRRPEYREDAGG